MMFQAIVFVVLLAGVPAQLMFGQAAPPAPKPAQKKAPSLDDQLFDQVRRRLANDPDVRGGAFQVQVKDGVVTLNGKVEKERYKQKAEKLAKKVKGVKSVVNQLTVEQRT